MQHAGRQRGFNFPELMISMVLGLFLLAAFMEVLQSCRAAFSGNESLARLQDSARHAWSVLVPDIEHAGFYGFANFTPPSVVRAGSVLAAGEQLRQPHGAQTVPEVAGLPAGSHRCGINFAVDLQLPVQGSDNRFQPGVGATDCAPTSTAGDAATGTDTLTLRRASLERSTARQGRLQIYSQSLQLEAPLLLFADGLAPGPVDENHEVRDLEVHTYYIANHSVGRAGWPALRVKALTESAGAAQFRDEELLPGVEDLQVQFGIARNDAGGAPRLHYVHPESPLARGGRVVAIRLWLRIRADATEPGFFDPRVLRYANTQFTPNASEARHRRLLVERTVALRNRPP